MKAQNAFFALLLAAGFLGCGKHSAPRHIVMLVDVSGSIDRDALAKVFEAIDDLVGSLKRGDRIAIIPILGDAEAEASGRIIRFEASMNRQAYDGDLRSFWVKLREALKEMEAAAVASPGSRTDILGSVALAEQEFQTQSGDSQRQLLILSDFIQEDRDIDFKADIRLANGSAAKAFATEVTQRSALDFRATTVFLGLLRSNEYVHLRQSRRTAVQEFWVSYFKFLGAQPKFTVDGPGRLCAASISRVP
jgi:hypothetical protein